MFPIAMYLSMTFKTELIFSHTIITRPSLRWIVNCLSVKSSLASRIRLICSSMYWRPTCAWLWEAEYKSHDLRSSSFRPSTASSHRVSDFWLVFQILIRPNVCGCGHRRSSRYIPRKSYVGWPTTLKPLGCVLRLQCNILCRRGSWRRDIQTRRPAYQSSTLHDINIRRQGCGRARDLTPCPSGFRWVNESQPDREAEIFGLSLSEGDVSFAF